MMAKRIVLGIVFSVFLVTLCITGQALASDTVGSFDWELSNVTDMQNHSVQLDQPVLSLDADFGFAFLSLYGALCPENGINCTPASGSGYFDNETSGKYIRMDIKAGTKIYRIQLSFETLGGFFARYDKDGNIEYTGSIDFVRAYGPN
jgi:hypothetical protein